MKGKTTPPKKKGVSGKKEPKRGRYPRTKAHREGQAKKVAEHRAVTPPTPAQQEAARHNGLLGAGPDEYDPKYAKALIEFFDKDATRVLTTTTTTAKGDTITREKLVGIDFPTIENFCRSIKVSHRTLLKWAKDHPEFGEALEYGKTCQAGTLLVNGMHGLYAQPLVTLFAKTNMGFTERVALGGDENAPPIEHVIRDEREKRIAACRDKLKQLVARGVEVDKT